MRKKIIKFLTGGCVVNTVLITALYLMRELFLNNILGRELSISVVFAVLLISFIISGADLLLEKPSAVSVALNYAAIAAGILLTFRLLRGKYDSGMQIMSLVLVYTVIYVVFMGARLIIRHLVNREKKERKEYSSVFK